MTSSLDALKVFISYSWKPMANKQKTIALAERMVNDGVNIILDEWNLAEGQDKYQFMEQMVNDPEIKRVLIICNKDYKEKADLKKGGVGAESLIISDKIYKQADQKKFIPVIFEKDEKGDAFVPSFIHSRIYIDLSSDDVFEDEYEKLLRNIFDKPASRKPPIGSPPAYLLEDEPTFLRTAHKVKVIQNALINEKKNCQVFVDDYYSTFIQALSDFEIQLEEIKTPPFIDELVLKKIEELKALRNDFINFLETIFTYSAQFDLDKFISFLEKLLEFLMTHDGVKNPSHTYGSLKLDNFRFFYNELFLYMTAVMIDKEKFKELGTVLHNSFVIFNKEVSKTETYSFLHFNLYAESLDKFRNDRLQMQRVSITADTIKQRADNPKYTFDKIRECDVLLYYIGIMLNETNDAWLWFRWFPQTTVYDIYYLPILEKLVSLRHFEKLKPLFDVNTIDELKQKIEKTIAINADRLQRFNHNFPYIKQAFDFTKMGTVK